MWKFMKTHQSNRTELLCAQWREGDGLPPRLEQARRTKSKSHKDQQLSKQAKRALSLFLEGESRHPDLWAVEVLSVLYEPEKQKLCINVGSGNHDTDGEAVLAALYRSQAALRSVVAASLHRNKVPALSFCYLGSHDTGGETCLSKL
jgi:ribosome-binding factor A